MILGQQEKYKINEVNDNFTALFLHEELQNKWT